MSVRQRAKAYEAAVANSSPTHTRKISGSDGQATRDEEQSPTSTPVAPPRKSRKRANTDKKENDPKMAQSAPKECTPSAAKGKKPPRPPPPTGALQDKIIKAPHDKATPPVKKPKPRLPPKPKHLLEKYNQPGKAVSNGLASKESIAPSENICAGKGKESEGMADVEQDAAVVSSESSCFTEKDQETETHTETKSEGDACDRLRTDEENFLKVVSDSDKSNEDANMDVSVSLQPKDSPSDVKEESKMDISGEEMDTTCLTNKTEIEELEINSEVGAAPQQGAQSDDELPGEKVEKTSSPDDYITAIGADSNTEVAGTDDSNIAADEVGETSSVLNIEDVAKDTQQKCKAGVSTEDDVGQKSEDLVTSDGRGEVSVTTSECPAGNTAEENEVNEGEKIDEVEQSKGEFTTSNIDQDIPDILITSVDETALNCIQVDEKEHTSLGPGEQNEEVHDRVEGEQNEASGNVEVESKNILPEDELVAKLVTRSKDEDFQESLEGRITIDKTVPKDNDVDASTETEIVQQGEATGGSQQVPDNTVEDCGADANAVGSLSSVSVSSDTEEKATVETEVVGNLECLPCEPESTAEGLAAVEQWAGTEAMTDVECPPCEQEGLARAGVEEFKAAAQDKDRDADLSISGPEKLPDVGKDVPVTEEQNIEADVELSFSVKGENESDVKVQSTVETEVEDPCLEQDDELMKECEGCDKDDTGRASLFQEEKLEDVQVAVDTTSVGELVESERMTVSSQGEPQSEERTKDAEAALKQQVADENTNLGQPEEDPDPNEPVRPSRPNRVTKHQKHAYENVRLLSEEHQDQVQEELYVVPRTQPPLEPQGSLHFDSEHQAEYDVPSSVLKSTSKPSETTAVVAEAQYSIPCTSASAKSQEAVLECEYDVPRPNNMTRVEAEHLDEEMYAVPSPVVKTTPSEELPATTESIYSVPKDKSSGESSALAQQSDDPTVPPLASSSKKRTAPPKPPRSSSLRGKRATVVKREEIEKESDAATPIPLSRSQGADGTEGSPKAKPRTQGIGGARSAEESPKAKPRTQGVGGASGGEESPKPKPRTQGVGEAGSAEESPEPKPRSSTPSDAAEPTMREKQTGDPSGSPVLRPRSQPLGSDGKLLTPVTRRHIGSAEKPETEEGVKRKAPPPRPPPPSAEKRASSLPPFVFSTQERDSSLDNSVPVPPLSPGLEEDLARSSESDSDGEESAHGNKAEEAGGPPRSKIYHIAHEILSTEQTFVNALKIVFEDCYGTIKSAEVVPESVLSDIFKDLENIYLLDSKFLQELEGRMRTWEDNPRVGDIIKKYSHFLKMYTQYVNGYDKAMTVFQETMNENPQFAQLVRQFQASELCQGLQVNSFMLKPVQRIPSYRLLLIDYLKHLPENSEEHEDIDVALKIVSEVAKHINDSMKKMDSFEQILKIQSRLIGHPEIVKAGRDFIKEGMLSKLCRKDLQPRMFFLLTDVLLYCTPVVGGNQFKLVRKLPLLGMKVTPPDSPEFVNEFSIISTTRSFTLTASTPEERDEWIQELNKAISVVTERKKTFLSEKDKDKDAIQLVDDSRLGQTAPVWIPDARATMCMLCTVAFTVTNRRHHCRACGRVVCNSCSDNVAPLVYLDYNQARVCDKCYEALLKDFHKDDMAAYTEPVPPPLLQESDETLEKMHRKPTKFEMMTRFKSRRRKRQSKIIRPSVLTEVEGAQEGSQMSGYLRYKKGGKGWKRMWFVLKDRVLYTYKASSDVAANETLPVLGYEVEGTNKDSEEFAFQLKHRGVTPMYFRAENETSKSRWIEELKQATKFA